MELKQNLGPAMQELRHSKSGKITEVSIFEKSRDGKLVKNCTTDEIKQVLRLVMLKVGVRAANLPNDEEKAVLITHILENYSNHTLEEFKLAFDLAINGKLDLTIDEVKHYENFSCLYFSTIINAYRKWAAIQHKEAKKPIEQKIYNPDELENICRANIESYYQDFKKGNIELNVEKDGFLDQIKKDFDLIYLENVKDFFIEKIISNAKNIYEKE